MFNAIEYANAISPILRQGLFLPLGYDVPILPIKDTYEIRHEIERIHGPGSWRFTSGSTRFSNQTKLVPIAIYLNPHSPNYEGHFLGTDGKYLDNPLKTAGVLAHEMIHSVAREPTCNNGGHGPVFERIARKIGFSGQPIICADEGPEFQRWFERNLSP